MEVIEHPDFSKKRSRFIGISLLSMFIIFPTGYWFVFGTGNLNLIFAAHAFVIVVFLSVYIYIAVIMKKRVLCPTCQGKTRSIVEKNIMYAECSKCNVRWDLGEQYNYD